MASSESDRGPVRARKYALAAGLAGVVLLAVSFLPALQSGRERWSTEQAREFQDASMRIQQLTHQLGSESPDTAKKESSAEFRDAINHFQNLRAQLEDARARSHVWATSLRIVGILLVIAGVGNYIAARQET